MIKNKGGSFMSRKFLYIISIITLIISINLHGFEEGFIWGLKANFNETLTIPSINNSDLDKMGATFLKGSMGFTMDGEAELGYLFGVNSAELVYTAQSESEADLAEWYRAEIMEEHLRKYL